MSLLLKYGSQYFEVSDADLLACETSAVEFANRGADAPVADRSLVFAVAVPVFAPSADPVPIGSGCTGPTDGASCGKAPNCP